MKGMQVAEEDPYHIMVRLTTGGQLTRLRSHSNTRMLTPPGLPRVQASSCCKHYVANSMDGTTQADGEQHDREHVDSAVTMQDLIDSCETAAALTHGRLCQLLTVLRFCRLCQPKSRVAPIEPNDSYEQEQGPGPGVYSNERLIVPLLCAGRHEAIPGMC